MSNKMNNEESKCCISCQYWRDKGWVKDEGIGICDNPKVIEQVAMLNEAIIKRFVSGETDKDKDSNARFVANSLRFKSSFGCIHHQK